MENKLEIIHSDQFRIKKVNNFLLDYEDRLIKGDSVLFSTKSIGNYISLFEKNGYNVESLVGTSQLKISL